MSGLTHIDAAGLSPLHIALHRNPAATGHCALIIPFLVAAYSLIWLVLLVYVFLLRRRTDAVVREVASLRAQIDAAARAQSGVSPHADAAEARPPHPRSSP